jgi:hypothetical protein
LLFYRCGRLPGLNCIYRDYPVVLIFGMIAKIRIIRKFSRGAVTERCMEK